MWIWVRLKSTIDDDLIISYYRITDGAVVKQINIIIISIIEKLWLRGN